MQKRDLAREAFGTDEGFKAIAARLKASPNTLRKWWKEDFGEEAFQQRGKRLQAAGASKFNRGRKGKSKNVRQEEIACGRCGASVTLNLIQKARLNRILCDSCVEAERGVDRRCPVCGLGCVGAKGLAMHMAHPQNDMQEHQAWLEDRQQDPWEGKQEGLDFIRCLVCGHKGARLDRHLKAEHDLGVAEYRARFPDAPVQADGLREAKAASAVRQHAANPRKGQKRVIHCPSCGLAREVGLTFAPSVHEEMCPDCVEEARWGTKTEGQDYVTCQVCGHRAESLVSHIRSVHPELEGRYQKVFPECRILSVGAAHKSDKHKQALSEAANPWRLGLTKETDERVAASAEKLAVTMSEVRAEKFWRSTDLIELAPEQLDPFKLKNGKVSVGRAMAALGHCFMTIQRECHRLGLEVSRGHIKEAACLDAVSQVLGGAPFDAEWAAQWAVNPLTGWHFRYDGFFPEQNLIVEFHGYQHWTFPSYYIESEEQFKALQARDAMKLKLAQDAGLRILVIREDEPYTDVEYLRERVLDVLLQD